MAPAIKRVKEELKKHGANRDETLFRKHEKVADRNELLENLLRIVDIDELEQRIAALTGVQQAFIEAHAAVHENRVEEFRSQLAAEHERLQKEYIEKLHDPNIPPGLLDSELWNPAYLRYKEKVTNIAFRILDIEESQRFLERLTSQSSG